MNAWKHKSPIIILEGIVAALIVAHLLVYLTTGDHLEWIQRTAEALTAIAAFVTRILVDPEALSRSLRTTDLAFEGRGSAIQPLPLRPERFLNVMPFAMLVGFIASLLSPYQIPCILVYILQQILLIFALSGGIRMKPGEIFRHPRKGFFIAIVLAWSGIAYVVFFVVIIPGADPMAWGALPYIALLVTMAIATFFGLAYTKRSFAFRLSLCIGASFFVFSDSVIGYTTFTGSVPNAVILIVPTWLAASFFLQLATLLYDERLNPLNGCKRKKK